jgi:hypothetical protein
LTEADKLLGLGEYGLFIVNQLLTYRGAVHPDTTTVIESVVFENAERNRNFCQTLVDYIRFPWGSRSKFLLVLVVLIDSSGIGCRNNDATHVFRIPFIATANSVDALGLPLCARFRCEIGNPL